MEQTKINEILELHKKWLNGDSAGVRADLRCANLRDANLRDADLWNADLWNADLRNADLRNANLRDTNLWNANLQDANLRDTNLWNANLREANLREANLQDANLRCANLWNADLRGANVDYSCLPLWCGLLNIKIDRRIAAQLAYHFCAMQCDDPEVGEMQKSMYAFANTFHRVGEVPRLGEG